MKMNTTAHYGLIAAGYIAEQADEGWVMASTISKKFDIPLEFLFKILQQMIRTNILLSKKGPRGGYSLARPAKEITLLEIIEAAGGPIATQLELAQMTKKAPFSVKMEKVCERASDKAASILSRAKLSSTGVRYKKHEKRDLLSISIVRGLSAELRLLDETNGLNLLSAWSRTELYR